MSEERIVGLGEILWDLLPTGPQLGGAPFNFTFHCQQLGHSAIMVSRVGRDELGAAIHAELRQRSLRAEGLQDDTDHPTGTVAVTLHEDGQPDFVITPEVAWDYLAWDEHLQSLCAGATALCFGTLIQRHAVSRATVRRALAAASNALIICDINLRQHYYDREVVEASLCASCWLKLNDQELPTLRDMLGLTDTTESALLSTLRRHFDLELACLTRGERGCLVQTATEEVAAPGIRVNVVDTVGAGDAFTAGLLTRILEGRPLREAAIFANRFASRVAAASGGTPRINQAEWE